MKNVGWVVLALSLFVLASAGAAYGDVSGETFDFSGTSTQTSPPSSTTGTFTGSFTIGSEIGSSSDWTVTAFTAIPSNCGATNCSTLTWVFSLEFDASNDSLFGSASVDYTGSDGHSKEFIADFTDGNTTSDTYQDNDLTLDALGDTSNDRSGTLAYTVSPTPELSTFILFGTGLLALGAFVRRKSVA